MNSQTRRGRKDDNDEYKDFSQPGHKHPSVPGLT